MPAPGGEGGRRLGAGVRARRRRPGPGRPPRRAGQQRPQVVHRRKLRQGRLVDRAAEPPFEGQGQLDAFQGTESELLEGGGAGDRPAVREAGHDLLHRFAGAGGAGRRQRPVFAVHPALQLAALQLLRAVGAGQRRTGPDGEGADPLAFLQLRVGVPHRGGRVGARVGQQHGVHVLASRLAAGDHGGVAHPGARQNHPFHVVRKDVLAVRRDDHLLLAAMDRQTALRVEGAYVAGMEPAVPERGGRRLGGVVVAAGDVAAAHQDLAVVGDGDLDAGDRLAHGPAPGAEGMVEGDDRRGLGQAVALDDQEPEPRPERLQPGIERRRADDERPELPAEQPVDPPVAPPAPRDVQRLFRGGGGLGHQMRDVVAQHVQDLRHADEDRHAAGPDLPDDAGRVVAAHEDGDALQHRRHEGRHRLAEHVAERQQVQEAERKEGAPVPRVLPDLALHRHDVGQHVRVRDPDAPGLGRGAGREDDLGQVVAARTVRGVRFGGGAGDAGGRGRGLPEAAVAVREQIVERPDRHPVQRRGTEVGARDDERGRDDPHDAPDQLRGGAQVDGHGHRAGEQAAPEGDDPLGAVLAPQHHAVAGGDAVPAQAGGEVPGGAANLAVRPGVAAVPAVVDEERPVRPDAIVEEIE